MSVKTRPQARTSHYSESDFADVEHIGVMTHEELEKEDKLKIAKYCERLIRSAENSAFVLRKFISKADLNYVNATTGDNLLNISILSGNFTPVDILLSFKCPRDVKNKYGNSAEGFVAMTSCHKTVKTIFKKYPVDVIEDSQDQQDVNTTDQQDVNTTDQVPQTVETTPV